jgi:hypothetical protein
MVDEYVIVVLVSWGVHVGCQVSAAQWRYLRYQSSNPLRGQTTSMSSIAVPHNSSVLNRSDVVKSVCGLERHATQ